MHLGLGLHYQALKDSYENILRNTFLNLFIEEIFYSTGSAFMKLSLLAFYWRIFDVPSIRWPIRILVTAVVAWLVARYIAIVYTASLSPPTGTKQSKTQPRRRRPALLHGIVAVSILLLVVCYKLDNTSPDITWNISPIALWAGTEINLGVVTAYLPSLRPIFLLVTRGSAQPDSMKQGTVDGKSKTIKAFSSKGRATKIGGGNGDSDDERHPFSKIDGERAYGRDIDLEEVRPPQDRVMVRDDVWVDFSRASKRSSGN
ncbi:MAG: hypothetical protein Q9226_008738 [Calogaya cf. arnoldii]